MPSGMIETDDVKREGREAYLNGKTVYANPYRPSTIAAVYWRKGFHAAQEEAEIAEQDAAGHFRDRLST